MIEAGLNGGRQYSTLEQYSRGFRQFVEVANSKGWTDYPFVHGIDMEQDLYRLSVFVHMQKLKGLTKKTVSNYISGVKFTLNKLGITSEALGSENKWHPWIRNSIDAIHDDANRVIRDEFPTVLIKAAQHLWSLREWVALVIIRGLALRPGEVLWYNHGSNLHMLKWKHIMFCHHDRVLQPQECIAICADRMRVTFPSRKHQATGHVRPVPDRFRTVWPLDGVPESILRMPDILDVVGVLQGWFAKMKISHRPQWEESALLADEQGLIPSARALNQKMKTLAERHGMNPTSITPHSLRHNSISTIFDSGASSEEICVVGGYADIQSAKPYIHSGAKFGKKISHILGK